MNKTLPKAISILTILALMQAALPMQHAQALSADIVISQVYGGGGNASAPYRNDFIELFNRGTTTVSLSGMSVQYASATGTGFFSSNPVTALSGSLAPGQYYLVQQASGGTNGVLLPTPDASGTVAMSATGGKVALVNSTTGLACNGSAGQPCSSAQLALIKDLVGYDGANFSEGSPTPALSNTTAALRNFNGCMETDNNASDFTVGTPTPRNTSSPLNPCPTDVPPSISGTVPANGEMNVAVNTNITVNFSEAVNVTTGAITVECPAGTLVASNAAANNATSVVIDPASDLPFGTVCVGSVTASGVTDVDTDDPPDTMNANFTWSFTTAGAPGPSVFINEIHYDNTGTDVGEAIEIAGPTCTDLTGWSVVLYNGSGGAVYDTRMLSGPIPNTGSGFGVVVLNYPSNGIQNGAPDGMALVNAGNNVVQFLSYEGTFTAVGGPANGMLSVDIGVSESGSGPVGDSLRLTGTGSTYNNFTWTSSAPNTFGAFNTGQTFTGGGTTSPCGVGLATPDTVFAGDSTLLTVSAISGTNPASTGLGVTANLSSIGGSPGQTFYDDGTNGDVTAGDNVFSYFATVAMSTTPGALSLPATVTDAQAQSGSASISLTVRPPLVAIHAVQGASHISPLNGQLVSLKGVVTAVSSNGFFMEEPAASWDGDDATSEGIFVFTGSAPAVNAGDLALVTGTVAEFRPGGSGTANLSTTEISNPGRSVTLLSTGNLLPPTTVIGTGGRVPPNMIIENDNSGDIETDGNVFDPNEDGIDFYESMEGMLVQVNNPVVVGPRNGFGEIFVLADDGANAGVRTARGGIVIQSNDFNPERIQLDDTFASTPMANVGDHFTGPAIGVLDYNFGNFEVLITSPMTAVSGGLTQETTTAADGSHFAVGTMNVENLDPFDPPSKFTELASLIVNNLQSPDILALEEVQDNNGATNDSVVDASTTFGLLIAAIQTAGGPTYDFRQVNPVDDQDGGEPGGNIRVGFLFRTDRGLSFVDRPGAGSTTANSVVGTGPGTQLQYSPGRIDPTNSAFTTSRKPLAAEFMFGSHHLFVIANHFNSKGGDNPLFGRFQPPVLSSEVQRLQQAQVVHNFVNSILTADPNAEVIVLGDLNDFEFSNPVNTLKGTPQILHALIETLPQAERYSYVFEGNSQALDHILMSNSLFGSPFEYDIVHVNSEFAEQASDHEPQVVRLLSYNFAGFFQPVENPPTLNEVKAGSGVPLKFSLDGFQGLNIFATAFPQSQQVACDSGAPVSSVEDTVTVGSSSLSYDSTNDQYIYMWKTNKTWAGACRQLIIRLNDGTTHYANFKFK